LHFICHDPDAPLKGGFTHWWYWNIDRARDNFRKLQSCRTSMNWMKLQGYKRLMCPPSALTTIILWSNALDKKLELSSHTDKATSKKAVKGHILAEGDLVDCIRKQISLPLLPYVSLS